MILASRYKGVDPAFVTCPHCHAAVKAPCTWMRKNGLGYRMVGIFHSRRGKRAQQLHDGIQGIVKAKVLASMSAQQ